MNEKNGWEKRHTFFQTPGGNPCAAVWIRLVSGAAQPDRALERLKMRLGQPQGLVLLRPTASTKCCGLW